MFPLIFKHLRKVKNAVRITCYSLKFPWCHVLEMMELVLASSDPSRSLFHAAVVCFCCSSIHHSCFIFITHPCGCDSPYQATAVTPQHFMLEVLDLYSSVRRFILTHREGQHTGLNEINKSENVYSERKYTRVFKFTSRDSVYDITPRPTFFSLSCLTS